MKKVLTIVVLISAVSISSSAQRHKNKDQFGQNNNDNRSKNSNNINSGQFSTEDKRDDRFDGLDLTPTQRNSMDSISREFDVKRQVLQQNPSLTKPQLKNRLQALRKEETELKVSFLTAKQKKSMRKERNQSKGKE